MRFLSFLIAVAFLTGCHPKSAMIEPQIVYVPQERHISRLPSAFPPLSRDELLFDWAKELLIGEKFARELDLFRAITALKRAQFLMPETGVRRLQVDYDILECYYLGGKFQEVIHLFEASRLSEVNQTFPPFPDLMLMLYDSYLKTSQCERADRIFQLIEKCSPETAKKLEEGDALMKGSQEFYNEYLPHMLSVRKAQTLNAVFPGAGYYYVGQKKAALTSFIINTLFTAAAIHFFEQGNVGAGIITASLEFGWYAGGINGAGLAAKEHNQMVYNVYGKERMIQKGLFPILMFDTSF